jgi:hypothetical protein
MHHFGALLILTAPVISFLVSGPHVRRRLGWHAVGNGLLVAAPLTLVLHVGLRHVVQSLAIESAVELARCLRDLPYSHAFPAYDDLRRDRVTRMIKLAARTKSYKSAGPIARRLRDVIMPIAMKLAKPEKTAWQCNHPIEWDTPVSDLGTHDHPVWP